MLPQKITKKINQQLTNLLQNNPLEDAQQNVRAIVLAIFNKLDLVTREEFDTQQKVLLATREKLEELEQLVNHLSKR